MARLIVGRRRLLENLRLATGGLENLRPLYPPIAGRLLVIKPVRTHARVISVRSGGPRGSNARLAEPRLGGTSVDPRLVRRRLDGRYLERVIGARRERHRCGFT
ncbi:MAG: hypothetical protein IPK37_07090 [Austwickia sp.]|nr:MAG: hypothetical protein IPK37_07090 [Austwickia sp.]